MKSSTKAAAQLGELNKRGIEVKREIYCRSCEEKSDFLKKEYPGEFVHVDRGDSKTECVCDYCGTRINEGEKISAISMGRGVWQSPFSNWTKPYLKNFDSPNGEYFP